MKIVYGRKNAIILNDRKLNFRKTDNKLPYPLMQELDKAPYMPPEKEEEREDKLRKLSLSIYVNKVQFGVFYRNYTNQAISSRRFSNEYEVSFKSESAGILWFEYDHKLIRIQVRVSCSLWGTDNLSVIQ